MQLPSWPFFEKDEIEAVSNVLALGRVNYWTGNITKSFEEAFAHYIGAKYAIALFNGTVALDAALHAISIDEGDEVIVPCRTFIATASSVALRKAIPIMVDIEKDTQNISADAIRNAITKKTKAIIVVHMAGMPCDMDSIVEIAKKHNLWLIEDCSQAHGAKYNGKYVGTFGHIGTFSFCQDKIISTGGEGGMVVTNDEEIWCKMWAYKDHGKSKVLMNAPSNFEYKSVHASIGTNYRMTEMQSAIGKLQLQKLPNWLKQRRKNAKILDSYIDDIDDLSRLHVAKNISHAFYKYYFFINENHITNGFNRTYLLKELNERGIKAISGVCPNLNQEDVFKEIGNKEVLPNADIVGKTSVAVAVHPFLNEEHIHYIGSQIKDIMNNRNN